MIDERPEDEISGSADPPGPRRSTFTPPPAGAEYRPGSLTEGEGALPLAAPAPSPMPVDAMPSAASPSPFSVPVSIPDPPRRASLTDEALLRVADPDAADADTSALITLVEEQLSLRVEEAERLQLWERAVRDAGVPDAEALVQSVRSSFTGVIDLVPPRDAAPSGSDDPWAQYPGTSSPPARWEEDREPANAPSLSSTIDTVREGDSVHGDDTAGDAPAAAAEASGRAGATSDPALLDSAVTTSPALHSALTNAPPPMVGTGVSAPSSSAPAAPAMPPSVAATLAGAPPPYGLVPSAVAPPPADDDTADIPIIPLRPVAGGPVPLVEPVPTLSGPTDLDRLLAGIPSSAAQDEVVDVLGSVSTPSVAVPPDASSVGAAIQQPAFPVAAPSPSAPSPSAPSASVPSPSAPSAPAPAAVGPAPHSAAGTPAIVPLPTTGPPHDPAALRIEEAALEPTPAALRAGRSLRLFWLWFSVSASVVSIGLGGVLLGLGMSLRQAILSALIGVAVSFLPLGLGTLAGKWSGQPTIVVSRATFGIVGNAVPAVLAVLTRLVWAAALLWMLGTGTASALAPLGLDPALSAPVAAAVGLLLAASVAGLGFGLIARVAAVASVLAAVLLVALVAVTAPRLDIAQALTIPDGEWTLVAAGAVLVFSVIGLAWAQSSGDLARYQARSTLGVGAVMWTGFGATLPAFLLVCWGALLAASDPQLALGLATDPIGALGGVLPGAGALILVLGLAVSLILAASLALYSGGFAILSAGLRAARWRAVLIAAVVVGVLLAALAVATPTLDALLRDGLTTLAVPVAAWAGVFGAETMIRRRRVHSPSLLRSGGVYPAVRALNLVALLVVTAVGWGLTGAETPGLGWQGYLWPLLGADAVLVASDLGVAVALALGLLVPVVAGVPAMRRLEAAERAAVDS